MNEFPLIAESISGIAKIQMVEVDRLMIEEFGINLFQMMENAGRATALISKKLFLETKEKPKVAILVGTGGNGGGGLVAARRLLNWGFNVSVFLSKSEEAFQSVPKQQLSIFKKMNGLAREFAKYDNDIKFDLIIDSIIGYNISGDPKNMVKDMIIWANREKDKNGTPILSLDLPSGIGSDGDIYNPAIKASVTLTLALPKKSMFEEVTKEFIGELYLADISVPSSLYKKIKILFDTEKLFKVGEILRIY